MLKSPFGTVRFAEFYAADVCTSLVKVFVDLAFSVCYFGTGRINLFDFLQNPL
jgi:hypothetical protein